MKKAWIAAAMTAGLLFAGAHTVSAGQTHPAPVRIYHVHAGDTLWSIAGTLRPHADRREVVYDLMSFNHLPSPVIAPGQTLRFPLR
ncbi:MAG: LysM peptidoglycan-binding domain-containing protein [Actinomycetota bacterium]